MNCEREEGGEVGGQHMIKNKRLLRAEFDHRLLSCVVALGHGFGGPRAIRRIWVPTPLTVGEKQPAEPGRAPLHFVLFRAFLGGGFEPVWERGARDPMARSGKQR